ncbi:MAG: tRNA (N(6)-L-threonylcarbamoyladenosine(37)-C(2))-methylthiotransferase MtaB [Chlamydiales bacterium]
MGKKKFRLATLGCRTNQYETQAYRDQLTQIGYLEAKEGEEAELCIVNTCTVTDSADRRSRHQIRQLIRQNRGAQVVVTGCLAEQPPDWLQDIEGISMIFPNQDKEELIAHLFPNEEIPEFSIKHFEAHTRAFVKVQDGCNSFCSYCIIPYVRGRSRSRPIQDVVHEVTGLVNNGYKDIVITGINVGDYEWGLANLMRNLDKIDGLARLRLSSIDPDEVDDELMETVLNGKHTCHSLHIVLQSGSNVILKKMNRKYTRQIFYETIEKLQRASPYFTFTTDVIVGFPGETDADFEETLQVMKEVQFAKVHMFPYSRRKRTRANLYPRQISQDIINTRKAKLMQVAEQEAFALREKYVGKIMSVLTESHSLGHTENFLTVLLDQREEIVANELINMRLVKNTPEGLIGIIDSHCS